MENLHNKVAELSIKHFNNLPKTGKPTASEWTILSCIVQQSGSDFQVVALGTGTKCIGKSKMSCRGDILNDSHAEVVCRRAFLRYLYEQLTDGDIFTPKDDVFILNCKIKFHFFTSQVPCGDAAIFLKQNEDEFGTVLQLEADVCETNKRRADSYFDMNAKKLKSDIYRTGAKCLPDEKQDPHGTGVEYQTLGVVRTKPGRGERTLSVSCSDKLAKWCHLGIQGALLTLLIEPIYLHSFTVGGLTPFNIAALVRALYDRISFMQTDKMIVGQSEAAFEFRKEICKKPCSSSIIWCKTNKCSLEVSVEGKKQGVTKKQRNTKAGRVLVSKVELYRTFKQAIKKLKLNIVEESVPYLEAKRKANAYQSKWNSLKHNSFKAWTTKEISLLNFVTD